MIGQLFQDRYRVLRKIGEGSMAEVYLVENEPLRRREALKVLKPAFASNAHLAKRFRREARAGNRLAHPNIVSIYDFGRLPDGRPFVVMEYAEGESIEAVLWRRGRLPLAQSLQVLLQLANAVDHAHACGVVHRDLKPANLILSTDRGERGVLKVLDFGIAKIVAPGYQETQQLSSASLAPGTPLYMAPEMFTGTGDDPRIDLYAVGCLAFELVVGEPPFYGRRALGVAHAHVSEPPPRPSERRPGENLPPEFDALVLRCLEKDPERRFATGAALAGAIQRIPGFEPESTGKGRRPSGVPSPPHLPSIEALDEEETEVVHQDSLRLHAESRADLDQLQVWGTIKALAARLLDLDCHAPELLVGMAELRDLEIQVDLTNQKLLQIFRQRWVAERCASEREAQLRFALGELRFDQADPGEEEPAARRLERRLDALSVAAEREGAALADREKSLWAQLDRRRRDLAEQYAELEHVVGQLVGGSRDPRLAALWRKLRRLRSGG